MSNRLEATPDKLTDADRTALAGLKDYERGRVREMEAETPLGKLVREHEVRECFTWTAEPYGTITFDVRGIKDAILSGEIKHMTVVKLDITKEWVEHITRANDVEPERLAGVKNIDAPGIAVLFPEGMSLIDGSHRLVRRHELGLPDFRLILLSPLEAFRYACRPGEEEEFFSRSRDPDAVLLKTEVRKV